MKTEHGTPAPALTDKQRTFQRRALLLQQQPEVAARILSMRQSVNAGRRRSLMNQRPWPVMTIMNAAAEQRSNTGRWPDWLLERQRIE